MFLIGKQIIDHYYANPFEEFVIHTLTMSIIESTIITTLSMITIVKTIKNHDSNIIKTMINIY